MTTSKSKKGVTLIEIIISLALLGIVVSTIFPLFATTMRINKQNERKQEIHEVLIQEIEGYRAKKFRDIIDSGEFNYSKKSKDQSYEIITSLEFEKDDLIGKGNYGYLELEVKAIDLESKEEIETVSTYISNNGEDTNIFIRVYDEWKKPNQSLEPIGSHKIELKNILNNKVESKETDMLGKVIYFDPILGSYSVKLDEKTYKLSKVSPNDPSKPFEVIKGATTYMEYWMYEPIEFRMKIGPGLNIELFDSNKEMIYHDVYTNKFYNDNTRWLNALKIRPLGIGNGSYYQLKLDKGELEGDKNGIYDEQIERNENIKSHDYRDQIKFGKWKYGKWYKYSWETGQWEPTGKEFGDHGQLPMYEREESSPKSGSWSSNPFKVGDDALSWFYSVRIAGEWIPADQDLYDTLYYRDENNKYMELKEGKFRLDKDEKGNFIFELNQEDEIEIYLGSKDIETNPIDSKNKIEIEIRD